MTGDTELDAQEARLQRAGERYAKVIGGDRCKFERGVKLITREKRLDRAMPWFRKFIRSRADTEEYADSEIASLRAEGFHLVQLDTLRRDFKKWKVEEKSRVAKQSREARGKRGRVRSKNDKRLGARLPGS
jgi:hypothetical protein